MTSKIKEISETIQREQKQSIIDMTSGHLNENHLYKPNSFANKKRKSVWSSSQKAHPTLRPFHRLETQSSQVERMKETLFDFTYLTLPGLNKKQSILSAKSSRSSSKSSLTEESLPPIRRSPTTVPSFTIGLSEEQRMNKMKRFGDQVLQKSDAFLHGLGYSEDFVYVVEKELQLRILKLESQQKRQTLSLTRLQLFSDALTQLVEGSIVFGPILDRIKNEYEFYLDHLLNSQPEYGTHIAEQLKRLRQAQPNFCAADSELFDIGRIEEETRSALERNKILNERLNKVRQEQSHREAAKSDVLNDAPVLPVQIKIKTESEQIDSIRQEILDLLDRMNSKKQELSDKFVPTSICNQLQQAVRDTEMDIIKMRKQNETLIEEIDLVEKRIKEKITSYDQSEFVQENIDQITSLLQRVDLLHVNKTNDDRANNNDRRFLHTYDDYFS